MKDFSIYYRVGWYIYISVLVVRNGIETISVLIGASLSEPYTSKSPMHFSRSQPCANNYRNKWKTHQHFHICFVSLTMPRWNNNVDYSTSIHVSCSQPCHGETNGIDYSTSNGRHKIRECWFSGLVVPIHSVLTVVILPSKNVVDL